MKFTEIQALSDISLVHQELQLERSLVQHQFRHRLGQLENTSVLGATRKDIARVQTELTRREKEQGLGKGTLKAKHGSSFVPGKTEQKDTGGGFLKGLMEKGE